MRAAFLSTALRASSRGPRHCAAHMPELDLLQLAGDRRSRYDRGGARLAAAPGRARALPNLRLVHALGAGVEQLLRRSRARARDVPVVRLVDPGMTAAMGEYVRAAGAAPHRQDLTYRAQQQARRMARAAATQRGASGASASSASACWAARRRCGSRCWASTSPAGAAASGAAAAFACHRGEDGLAALARAQRHPGLPAAAHAGDREHSRCAALRGAAARRGARQLRARRASGRGRSAGGARQRAALGGGARRRSAPSRCRRIIRSGASAHRGDAARRRRDQSRAPPRRSSPPRCAASPAARRCATWSTARGAIELSRLRAA